MDQLSPFKCFRNTRKRPEWCASHNKEYLMEEAFDITARKKKISQENCRPGACFPAYETPPYTVRGRTQCFPWDV